MNHVHGICGQFPIGDPISITHLSGGLVHVTYKVVTSSGTYILQRVSPIFAESVNTNVRAVTEFLLAHAVETYALLSTHDGSVTYFDGEFHWRVLTFLHGRIVTAGGDLEEVASAGRVIGHIHEVLRDYPGGGSHPLPGYHDTDRYMEKLRFVDRAHSSTPLYEILHERAEDILRQYEAVDYAVRHSSMRTLHGDPQIENVMFRTDTKEAFTMIDLDTVWQYPIATEIGFIGWSWTKQTVNNTTIFSSERWRAVFEGYRSSATTLSDDEWHMFPHMCVLATLEQRARYVTDAYEEQYYTLDPGRYQSLYEQNTSRDEELRQFLLDFDSKRSEIEPLHRRSATL